MKPVFRCRAVWHSSCYVQEAMEQINLTNFSTKPCILDFTDYRVFLGRLWSWLRDQSGITYAEFSQRAGFRSRSFLRLVIAGKRQLTLESMKKVAKGLNFSREESETFEILVQFNQASDFKTRMVYWEKYSKRAKLRQPQVQTIADTYTYLARFYIPILHSLLFAPNISQQADDLAKMLKISTSEVEAGIRTLVELGLIKNEDGKLKQVYGATITTDGVPSIAVQTFHFNMLEKSKNCLSLPNEERNYQTLMTPLSVTEYEQLLVKVKQFLDEIQESRQTSLETRQKLYSININLIPLTTDFIRPEACQKSAEIPLEEDIR